ncbi:MAG: tRNA (adenosine(37)-N6)-dimethylallyltransferase MiaA [Deltaproteobacteria bacterium]|jgi:tRNA dimethylallyltransferase|nr:tRNA (adenosine(37)-N6)-dimethylallyltransferase MiaA [Deltaproteobacteria bacterium]
MSREEKPKALIITGVTGSGKSQLGMELAQRLGGAIINADSLSFYKGFDIGTAKPSKEDMETVPHHLFDILTPDRHFDAFQFLTMARDLVRELWSHGQVPLVVGGTGLYIRSLLGGLFVGPKRDEAYREELTRMEKDGVDLHNLLKDLDAEAASRIFPRDRVRIVRALEVLKESGESITKLQERHNLSDDKLETLNLLLSVEKERLDSILRERVKLMLQRGLIEETEGLIKSGYSTDLKPFQSIGYKETLEYLAGALNYQELEEKIFVNTRKLAKRQRTWFRKQLPNAVEIQPGCVELAFKLSKDFLKG